MAVIQKASVSSGVQAVSTAYNHCFAISTSDVDNYDVPIEVYVGVTGNVVVVPARTDPTTTGPTPVPVTFTAVPAGTRVPVRVSRVMTAGTTATGLVGLC